MTWGDSAIPKQVRHDGVEIAMPELPDVEAYIWALKNAIQDRKIVDVRLRSVFLVRTYDPPFDVVKGSTVRGFRRIGKRIVFELEREDAQSETKKLWMVLHLMISGRLRWRKPGAGFPGKMGLCALDFEHGTLMLTEASKKKRASIHLVESEEEVAALDPGGLEIVDLDEAGFKSAIQARNHTLKRALTDPRILSGIGGAYADEIMHRAKISPVKWTTRLDEDEIARLFDACRTILDEWRNRIIERTEDGWPEITAFQEGMAVHGRYGKPCPTCGDPVQRIVYASNETNYCATCQTDGRLLADRSLSRLLKKDWPRTLEELEEQRSPDVRSRGQQ
jgi:formamidopyrimidine-DNA glycosylase